VTGATIAGILIATVAVIPGTLAACATLVTALTTRKEAHVRGVTANEKADDLARQSQKIYVLANSNLEHATTALADANKTIVELSSKVATLQEHIHNAEQKDPATSK
jgi:hypothetical protein